MSELTGAKLADGFRRLADSGTAERAAAMGAAFKAEDGAGSAVAAFYRHLPLDAMACDVAVWLPPLQRTGLGGDVAGTAGAGNGGALRGIDNVVASVVLDLDHAHTSRDVRASGGRSIASGCGSVGESSDDDKADGFVLSGDASGNNRGSTCPLFAPPSVRGVHGSMHGNTHAYTPCATTHG